MCVYRDGKAVVDLWGGVADPRTNAPWQEETIVLVFSSTKGVTAVCANLLIKRGRLDPDATVASLWPEFAVNGKETITVGDVLADRAGLPYVEGDFTLEQALDWDTMVTALARQAPVWVPGEQHGYHMRTYGWLVGELVRVPIRGTVRSGHSFARRSRHRSGSTSGSACPIRRTPRREAHPAKERSARSAEGVR